MHAHRDLLQLAGTFLAGLPTVGGEWSLKVSGKGAVVRDRVLFWAGRRDHPDNDEAFARVGAFLRALDTPGGVLAIQQQLARISVRQGVGIVLSESGDPEVCLYVHHDRYDAWKWSANESPEHSYYEFHPLRCRPTPIDLVHAALRPLYRSLAQNERLQTMSGFFLRHRRDRIDQVDLAYPWQPAVGAVLDLDALQPWRDHHFRHIAMNGPDAAEPSMTLYFSGALRTPWPRDAAELRERVRLSARAAHAALSSRDSRSG